MDDIKALCEAKGVLLLEDCAHSLGVLWNGGHTGHHGAMAAFSSQSYKMLNSGEGGFFVTDDDFAHAKAMAYAGAYEVLADKHECRPCDAALAEAMDGSIPNFSLRMHEATAAMLRPQILTIEKRRAECRPARDTPIQLVRGDASLRSSAETRRRRGRDVDSSRRRVAAATATWLFPRRRGAAAAATWIFRSDASRRRRG